MKADLVFGFILTVVVSFFVLFTVLIFGSIAKDLSVKNSNAPLVTYEVRIVSQVGHEETYEMNSKFEPQVRYYGIPDVYGSENSITFPEGWLATVKKKENVEN